MLSKGRSISIPDGNYLTHTPSICLGYIIIFTTASMSSLHDIVICMHLLLCHFWSAFHQPLHFLAANLFSEPHELCSPPPASADIHSVTPIISFVL
ncbi:hypothetical protein CC78DRAFT_281801 [Lojkania enalia]|uniref:Uncharacterized protein n=1 Tax=Lojkania enalia TaxID=147567 RepID=A0A9P4NA82_9PLEO|nr:hypothetical protein CC78DRAFT_281801 [Didymosphaeria enalia]